MRSVGGGADVPHAIVLAWSFPPVASSAARRTADLVAALVEARWRVTVLTVDSPATHARDGLDPALERRIPASVRVLRIEDDHPDHLQRIDRWPHERALDPAGWRDAWLARAAERFDEPGHGHVHDRLRDEALRVADTDGADLVVAVVAPLVTLAVAADVSARHGADLAVDFARVTDEQLMVEGERVSAALARAARLWVPDRATRDRVAAIDTGAADRATVVADGLGGIPVEASPARHRPLRVLCFVEPDAWDAFVEVIEGWLAARATNPALAGASLHVRAHLPQAGAARSVLAQCADRGVSAAEPPSADDLPQLHRDSDLVVVVSRGDLPAGRTTDHLTAAVPVVWCTAAQPAADHPFEEAAHVVRAADLSPRAITAALAAAVGVDPAGIAAPHRESGWSTVVEPVAPGRTTEGGR